MDDEYESFDCTGEPFFPLDDAYALSAAGQTDDALDLLAARFDDMLCGGHFAAVDVALRRVDVARMADEILVGLLMYSAPAADRLPSRVGLIARIRDHLRATMPPNEFDELFAVLS